MSVEDDIGRRAVARREVTIEASPEEIWESLATEEGRDRWLDSDDADREIVIVEVDEPQRLVWWWRRGEEPATRVEFHVVAAPAGTRVVVIETAPSFPLARLAASLTLAAA